MIIVTSKTVPDTGVITFEYDIIYNENQGYVVGKITDPKGNITTKVYDRVGRLKFVKNRDINSTNTTTYNYYTNGRRESLVYSDGSSQVYTYYDNGLIHLHIQIMHKIVEELLQET